MKHLLFVMADSSVKVLVLPFLQFLKLLALSFPPLESRVRYFNAYCSFQNDEEIVSFVAVIEHSFARWILPQSHYVNHLFKSTAIGNKFLLEKFHVHETFTQHLVFILRSLRRLFIQDNLHFSEHSII